MQRFTIPVVLMIVGLTAALLASAIALQYVLFRQDRLHHLEQVNGSLSREFARIIEDQTGRGAALSGASRILGRVASMQSRSGLISLLAVTDPDGEPVFYFDDHPGDSYRTPSLRHVDIEREWQASMSSSGSRTRTWSRHTHGMLFVAAPVYGPSAQLEGMVVLGLAEPAPFMRFLFETHSPLIAASMMIYLSVIVALLVVRRMKTTFGSAGSGAIASDVRPNDGTALDLSIARAEQALDQLKQLAQ